MELSGYYIRIAKLIALEITDELSESEQEELNKWLSTSEENKLLYKKIRSEITDLIEKNKKVNVQHDIAWEKIARETTLKEKSFSRYTFLKYAAVFIIVIATSIALYYNFSEREGQNMVVDHPTDTELQPGYQRAFLVTSNGSNVELDKQKKRHDQGRRWFFYSEQ